MAGLCEGGSEPAGSLKAICCQVFGFIGGLTGTVSITTLTAIALDRYFVIMYPLEPKRKTTHRRARMYALFTWCYGCVFSLPPLLGLKQYVPEGYLTSCSYDYLDLSFANRVYIFSFFTAAWVIPFCIITVCYIGICYAVFVTRNVKQTSGKDSSRHEKTRSEIRLAGVVIGIISLWFAAWTPYAAVSLLGITGNKQYITPLSSMIPALFCKIASCIDPYVYAVTHSRFRMEFKSFIRRVSVKREARRYSSKSQKVWATQSDIVKRTPETEVSSEESNEVEEVIVMVDMQAENTVKDTASHIKELVVGKKQVSFPMSDKDKNKFRPPSWFVAPKPIRDRSTSFRKHFKDKDQK
ncbi:hypothetical protein ANN_06221 [Periplaneta americana]|uniref:G-protein coupled receptors family 1 profile domain-containing protein n=1 Tax=Periplaneta americana TaxID=6978 RepID=A0ABQ8TD16_PERAM|nr:hypothetical protein ANN_06221 [Periplaneta americana]